ncbi:YfcC family protein [Companilactobacillus baiquanensis]|uniref:YfcC family protein n=1 Tax=Companilactobacillus baiquanensis TaxID=2486005 RepID=A0ABW1UY28_9LACO|nr:YfcC family protein [Companilactobacillus baiquanensis]
MQETKSKWHMPSAFTILFILIILVAILTWIIPAGEYATTKAGNVIAGTYRSRSSSPQGLWDIFEAPINGMIGTKTTDGAIPVSLYILVIGGVLGVVNRTNTFADGIGSAAKKYKGREKYLIPFLMTLFALGGTVFGMGEETIAFVPIVIPIMLSVGYDTITAISITLIGSQIGCMGSTVNPFATGVASDTIHISLGQGILPRVVFLILSLIIGIIYVMRYAAKVKNKPDQSLVYERYKKDLDEFVSSSDVEVTELTKRQKWVLFAFIMTFVIMIIGLVPWATLNPKWTFFADFLKWLNSMPFIGSFVGRDMVPFGTWGFVEITTLIFFASLVIKAIYQMKEADFIDAFMGGVRDFVEVAMIVAIARGIQVIMNNGYISATILHAGEVGLHGLSSSVFIILTYIFYIPMSFLIPSSSGLAVSTMGIIGPIGRFSGVPGSTVVTAYQIASGLVNLITPTSAIVMGSLALGHVGIVTWFKYIWKLLLIFIVFTCIFLAFCTIFNFQ